MFKKYFIPFCLVALFSVGLLNCSEMDNSDPIQEEPILHQILPINSTIGGPVVLIGNNLKGRLLNSPDGLIREETKVYFDSHEADLVKITDTAISLHVPFTLDKLGWTTVEIEVGEMKEDIQYEIVSSLSPDQNSLPTYLLLDPKEMVKLSLTDFAFFGQGPAKNVWSPSEYGDQYRWWDSDIELLSDSTLVFEGNEYIEFGYGWDAGTIYGEYDLKTGIFRCSLTRNGGNNNLAVDIPPDVVYGAFYDTRLETSLGLREDIFLIVTSETTGRQYAFW